MSFGQLPYDLAHLLGGAVLLLSFVLLYQRRISAVINAFATQGALLALAALLAAWDEQRLRFTAPLERLAPNSQLRTPGLF